MDLIHSYEATRHYDARFEAGCVPIDYTWQLETMVSMSFDVFSVSWDIFLEDSQDLLDFIWSGRLSWSLGLTGHPYQIGCLNLYDGSFLESARSTSGHTDLQQIVSARGEAELLELARHHQRGNGSLYRGLKTYWRSPFCLPAGASDKLRLVWSESLSLRGTARLRINLNGLYRHTLQVG